MKTITIIGGGLAGLSLGNALLRRGVPVILHEKKSYPMHRVCGEFISGVSEETIQALHLTEHLKPSAAVSSVAWFIGDRNILNTPLERSAYGISRHLLDSTLAAEFQKLGGDLRLRSRYERTSQKGVVRASGKPMNQGGNWIALSVHLKNTGITQLEMHSGPNGYIGLSPIEDGLTNVTGLFKKQAHLRGKKHALIISYLRDNGLSDLAEKLSQSDPIDGSFCAISGFEFGTQPTSPSELRLGDASQLVPPFVGNGMSMALESAAIAAEPLTEYASGKLNWEASVQRIQDRCAALFSTRMKVAMRFHPVLLSKLGLKAISTTSKLNLLPVKTLYHLTR